MSRGYKSARSAGEDSFPRWQDTAAGLAFPDTRWSVVVNAARDNVMAAEALEILCRTYWYPLYAYVRFQGIPVHDAQDLTQSFFEHLLAGDALALADPRKGRLRSYLLGALKNHLACQRRREGTLKRGGGSVRVTIDDGEVEARLALEIQANPSENPDRLFERRWAVMLLDRVLDQLAAEFDRRGKADEFEALSPYLAKDAANGGYGGLAEQLMVSEGAIRVAVHRMRKRYREILQREILATVASEAEVESEIDHLFSVLG